jgi:hypothetical protein
MRRRYAAGADGAKRWKLSMNYTTEFKSIRAEVSAEEWQARVDLAACYRLVDKYAMTDLIYNHITARIPGSEDHLLINLYGMLYKEITASRSTSRARSFGNRRPITASTNPVT